MKCDLYATGISDSRSREFKCRNPDCTRVTRFPHSLSDERIARIAAQCGGKRRPARVRFLLGDFLERLAVRLFPDPDRRNAIGKKIDRLFGMPSGQTCGCVKRQRMLNEWTRMLVSKPLRERPGFVLVSAWRVASRISNGQSPRTNP